MYKRFLSILLSFLFLTGCAGQPLGPTSQGQTTAPPPTAEPDPRAGRVEALLSAMTLEEKVGQLFFVRCPSRQAAEKVSAYHLGGFILFDRDFHDDAGNWLTREQFMEQLAAYDQNREPKASLSASSG